MKFNAFGMKATTKLDESYLKINPIHAWIMLIYLNLLILENPDSDSYSHLTCLHSHAHIPWVWQLWKLTYATTTLCQHRCYKVNEGWLVILLAIEWRKKSWLVVLPITSMSRTWYTGKNKKLYKELNKEELLISYANAIHDITIN